MIFLDANAFYSYYGRSKLGMTSEPVDEKRLKKYLDQQSEKSLPTSVYIEIMTHFRNNPKVLQSLLEFRYAKGLPLFNNIPDYVVSEDEITSVAYMDQVALKNYADRLLKSKINVCITKISTFLILCDLAVCLATLYVSFSLVFALMRYLQGKVFLIRFYSPTTLSSSRAEFRLPSRLACA